MQAEAIVDSHVHLWDSRVVGIPWLDDAPAFDNTYISSDYAQARAAVEVAAMVFVECDVAPGQAIREVEWVSRQALAEPGISAIVAHAPLEQGDAVLSHLEQLSVFPLMRGVRRLLQAEADPEFCLMPSFIEGIRLLPRFGWSFDVCVYHYQLKSVVELVRRCPEVQFVLDHIGKPDIRSGQLQPWAEDLNALAKCDNVACKLAGVVTEAAHDTWSATDLQPYLDVALSAFGPSRLMFGSDWPVCLSASSLERWVDIVRAAISGLSFEERCSIWSKTCQRIYRL